MPNLSFGIPNPLNPTCNEMSHSNNGRGEGGVEEKEGEEERRRRRRGEGEGEEGEERREEEEEERRGEDLISETLGEVFTHFRDGDPVLRSLGSTN